MTVNNNNLSEEKRLEDLYSYEILDTAADPIFDQITAIASSVANMPICLISLIDENRQWFKSSVGLNVTETPRGISFCTHAIEQEEVFEVRDASTDERFKNNPLVVGDPNIRYYAGAPLTTPSGNKLGTLCVIDHKPNSLTPSQIESLKILAQQVVDKLELKRINKNLSLAKEKLEIQQELLIKKAKVQTIGELTTGLCHQINNPLAIIIGHSMVLKSLASSIAESEKTIYKKELEAIDQTTLRISEILSALRTYSKEMGTEVKKCDMMELVDDVMTLVRGKFLSLKITTDIEMEKDLSVSVNKNQIVQVILNLLTNACEALEKSQQKDILVKGWSDKDFVYVDISDSGPGITQDTDKIFESFFTTKARNFGIGLSNSQSFMEENLGELTLVKAKGPTTFRMKLPKTS